MIDLGRAIQHPFEDKDWAVKMLIGAGISMVPILNFAMSGYALQAQRNAALGRDVPLPRWDDLGKYLTDGLKILVVQLIYVAPILLITFGMSAAGMLFGMTATLARGALKAPAALSDIVGAGFTVASLGLSCLIMLYSLVAIFILPATLIQLARTGQISAAFHFNEILAVIRRRTGDYVLVVFMPILIGFAFSAVFGIISLVPFIGLCFIFILIPVTLLIYPYVYMVFGHLYGQLMRP